MARWRNGVAIGVFDWRQVAEAAVRPNHVVVQSPNGERLADMAERGEQRLVQKLVAEPAIEALDKGVLLGLSGSDVVPLDMASCDQRRIAMLVSSVPLSLTTVAGLPRTAMTVSSLRASRMPDSEVSARRARGLLFGAGKGRWRGSSVCCVFAGHGEIHCFGVTMAIATKASRSASTCATTGGGGEVCRHSDAAPPPDHGAGNAAHPLHQVFGLEL